MRAARLFLILLFANTVAVTAGPRFDAVCTTRHGGGPLVANTIALVAGANVKERLLEEAVSLWRGCANYEADFPAFVIGGRGDRVIEVNVVRGSSGGLRCGVFSHDRIELYRSAVHGGRPIICGPLARNLAHELGHVLGLHDAQHDPSCLDHIMANVAPLSLIPRAPQESECRSVGQHWLTLAEITSRRPAVARSAAGPREENRTPEALRPSADSTPGAPLQ